MRALRCELLTWASGELMARHHLLDIVFGCGVYGLTPSARTKGEEKKKEEDAGPGAEEEVEANGELLAEAKQAEEVQVQVENAEAHEHGAEATPKIQLLRKVRALLLGTVPGYGYVATHLVVMRRAWTEPRTIGDTHHAPRTNVHATRHRFPSLLSLLTAHVQLKGNLNLRARVLLAEYVGVRSGVEVSRLRSCATHLAALEEVDERNEALAAEQRQVEASLGHGFGRWNTRLEKRRLAAAAAAGGRASASASDQRMPPIEHGCGGGLLG